MSRTLYPPPAAAAIAREVSEWDFIVVGAGSAGCVVASRLSENGRSRVLLLEAGGHDMRPWIHLPVGYARTFTQAAVNWMYESEPEPGLDGRRIYQPRGKVMGGSSSINAMVWVRGQPRDFDDWGPGWGWSDVEPWFRRAEAVVDVVSMEHGVHPLCETWLQTCDAMGYGRTGDFNRRLEGTGIYRNAMRGGTRLSAARAYLPHAVRRRANLRIEKRAHATRILFEGRRAVGVEYARGGRTIPARGGEIVLTAGAFNTPQLLQLSGIGPEAVLRAHGIGVLEDLPVGEGLQDHLFTDISLRVSRPSLNRELTSRARLARHGLLYALQRRGPLSMGVNQAGGFLRTGGAPAPDMQVYFAPISYRRPQPGEDGPIRLDPFAGVSLSAQPCRPTSRGRVVIASRDPFAPPLIRANYLDTEEDRAAMLRGARLLRRMARTEPLETLVEEQVVPVGVGDDDEALLADIRARASTVYHPVGTCALGRVTDREGRVRGVERVRVADASLFASITSGNTNAPTTMAAEKIAAAILAAQ